MYIRYAINKLQSVVNVQLLVAEMWLVIDDSCSYGGVLDV